MSVKSGKQDGPTLGFSGASITDPVEQEECPSYLMELVLRNMAQGDACRRPAGKLVGIQECGEGADRAEGGYGAGGGECGASGGTGGHNRAGGCLHEDW